MKKMIVSGWEEEKGKKKRRRRRRKDNFKIRVLKPDERDLFKFFMMMIKIWFRYQILKPDERGKKMVFVLFFNDDKNMVQIHDEQRSIQMTILRRYIYTKTLLRQAL